MALAGLLSVAALVVYGSPGLSAGLQYDRSAIASGETWRLLTCHWTHWSLDHLLWDTATFAVLAFVCATRSPRRFAQTLGVSSLAISAAVWFSIPQMQTYRGLSGPASALAALLIFEVVQTARGPLLWACSALFVSFVAKVGYEGVTGTCVFVDADAAAFVPVPLAHAVGALAGAAVALLTPPRFR